MTLENLSKKELQMLVRDVLFIRNIPSECFKQAKILALTDTLNPLVDEHNELFGLVTPNVTRHKQGKRIAGKMEDFAAQLKRLNVLSRQIDLGKEKLEKLRSEVDMDLNYFFPFDLWDNPNIPKSREAIALDAAVLEMMDDDIPALEVN